MLEPVRSPTVLQVRTLYHLNLHVMGLTVGS